jgi:hypothetical protein
MCAQTSRFLIKGLSQLGHFQMGKVTFINRWGQNRYLPCSNITPQTRQYPVDLGIVDSSEDIYSLVGN